MYANFMAHPDMFLSITAGATAEDRIVRFVEYYLTAFHEGRKGAVAKKPYNPILGETFHCSWEVPWEKVKPQVRSSQGSSRDQSRGPNNSQPADDSSAGCYRVRFVAEQVSHHPPVSGFYCECRERKMCVSAHVWTKSKFMGMSIGVSMVGEGELVHNTRTWDRSGLAWMKFFNMSPHIRGTANQRARYRGGENLQ